MREMSKRTAHVGIQLEPAVKAAIKHEAKCDKTSVSAFVARVLQEELDRRGVVVSREPPYTGELLPLEVE